MFRVEILEVVAEATTKGGIRLSESLPRFRDCLVAACSWVESLT